MTKSKVSRPSKRSPHSIDDVTADQIVAEVDAAIDAGEFSVTYPRRGRPSLTGLSSVSPTIGFRLPPDLRELAEAVAERQGTSVSALARQALEDYLKRVG